MLEIDIRISLVEVFMAIGIGAAIALVVPQVGVSIALVAALMAATWVLLIGVGYLVGWLIGVGYLVGWWE